MVELIRQIRPSLSKACWTVTNVTFRHQRVCFLCSQPPRLARIMHCIPLRKRLPEPISNDHKELGEMPAAFVGETRIGYRSQFFEVAAHSCSVFCGRGIASGPELRPTVHCLHVTQGMGCNDAPARMNGRTEDVLVPGCLPTSSCPALLVFV